MGLGARFSSLADRSGEIQRPRGGCEAVTRISSEEEAGPIQADRGANVPGAKHDRLICRLLRSVLRGLL